MLYRTNMEEELKDDYFIFIELSIRHKIKAVEIDEENATSFYLTFLISTELILTFVLSHVIKLLISANSEFVQVNSVEFKVIILTMPMLLNP